MSNNYEAMGFAFTHQGLKEYEKPIDNHIFYPCRCYAHAGEKYGREAGDFYPIMEFLHSAGEQLLREDIRRYDIKPAVIRTEEEMHEFYRTQPDEMILAALVEVDDKVTGKRYCSIRVWCSGHEVRTRSTGSYYVLNKHYLKGRNSMYSFNCLIKTDASLVKGSLSESHGETELLANLYGKIICIEDDANGMSPTETVPTPVDVFDIILGYREASELISFAEDMKKRALHAALETARYALKKWDKDGISIQSSLEKCFCTIPMGSTEAYNLSCATDILSNHPCSEACELFYNGIEWKCYPDDTELNDVIAHPEQYIVIPVLFSDK